MGSKEITREEMWARQQISCLDVDYQMWDHKRKQLQQFAEMSSHCIFTVDVFKGSYDYASDQFATFFDFKASHIRHIAKQGDLIEDRIHPDDRSEMINIQIKHSQFIYSLPPEERNNFRNMYRFRMLNRKRKYIHVISRQQVFQTDKNGKAWIILGMMDISLDQRLLDKVEYTTVNLKTGELIDPIIPSVEVTQLTTRESEILQLIRQGLLSKEIALCLGISIHTIHNHRKNILTKLGVDNTIEAINKVYGLKV